MKRRGRSRIGERRSRCGRAGRDRRRRRPHPTAPPRHDRRPPARVDVAPNDRGGYALLDGPRSTSTSSQAWSVDVRVRLEVDEARRWVRATPPPRAIAGRGRSAPMPESSSRSASPGDLVRAGQTVAVIEAMKMQNGWSRNAGRVREVRAAGADRRLSAPLVVIERTARDERGAKPLDARRLTPGLSGSAPSRRPPARRSAGLHARARRRYRQRVPRRIGEPGSRRSRAASSHDVPRPALDDAPVRRVRHGRRDERALPLPPRAGADRSLGRLRSPDADGPRRRRRHGGRGGRQGRRVDLHARGPRAALRGDPARRRDHLDDDQRDRADPPRDVRRAREAPGRAARACRRHDPE